MKFRIHYSIMFNGNLCDESVVIEGETIEEIQEQAIDAVYSRNGTNPWSEELED